ncbi:type II secretion system protein [Candidatus Daviesbacteria bacterium]|nr:type II secretion system protein [Candidatus Daviesbacteria bacterium]
MKKTASFDYAQDKRGFTLVELLVVVAIIAVLSVIGITIFSGVQKSARDARRKADINAISNALEADFSSNNRTEYQTVTGGMFSGGVMLTDPTNSGGYDYKISALPLATYTVCAKLESGNGGNSSDNTGTAAANGGFYCQKSQQ